MFEPIGVLKSSKDYRIHRNEELNSFRHRYIIKDYINRGVFGQVVKAVQVDSGALVAIKIIRKSSSYNQNELTEIHILETLTQSNADRFFITVKRDFFEHLSHTCIVTDLLSINLFQFVNQNHRNSLPLYAIRVLTYQILIALQKLEQLGIIHADLKPDNIMLVDHKNYPYYIKVIDFGAAMYLRYTKISNSIQPRYYRSPEIIMGCSYDHSIDIWSLGCIMAELFLGTPIFPGYDDYQQLFYIMKLQGIPTCRMLNSGVNVKEYFKFRDRGIKQPTWTLKTRNQYYKKNEIIPTYWSVNKPNPYIIDINLGIWNIPLHEKWDQITDFDFFMDLLELTLNIDPIDRISPEIALNHDFFKFEQYLTANSLSLFYSKKHMNCICDIYKKNNYRVIYPRMGDPVNTCFPYVFGNKGMFFRERNQMLENNNFSMEFLSSRDK